MQPCVTARHLAAALCLLASTTALAQEPSEQDRAKVSTFEQTLFIGGTGENRLKQKPLAEQRPLVEAFFPTLKTRSEKLAFLELGVGRYVYALNRDLYGEYALKLLKDPDAVVRAHAAGGISFNLLKQYNKDIELLRDDPDPHVRNTAIVVLGVLGRHDLAPAMAQQAASAADDLLREVGLRALRMLLRDSTATPSQREFELAAIARFLDPAASPKFQQRALESLSRVPEVQKYADPIVRLAASTDQQVRLAALRALEHVTGDAATRTLVQALTDANADTRSEAAKILGTRKSLSAAPDIAKLLSDPVVHVRKAAIEALAKLDARDHIDAIAQRLRDENEWVRAPAAEALGTLKASTHAPQVATLLSDLHTEVRLQAVRALHIIGTREQAAAVATLANDETYSIRLWVIRVLEKTDARDQRPTLEKLASDNHADVAHTAKLVLQRWDAK